MKFLRSIGKFKMLLEFLLNENENQIKININDFLTDSKSKFLTQVI
jgi:hypothetical protein